MSPRQDCGPDRLPALLRKPDEETQKRLNAKLLTAAKKGDTKKAQRLITKGADVDARDELRWTPLMYAAYNGHRKTADMLLSLGALVDARNNVQWTALMLASHRGRTKTAETLINHGAYVNETDIEGWTALNWAMGHPETFAMLGRHGANMLRR